MEHFLEIAQLSSDEIENLTERALHFKYQGHYPHYTSFTLANLFYENSTRTRISFEMAARHLSTLPSMALPSRQRSGPIPNMTNTTA